MHRQTDKFSLLYLHQVKNVLPSGTTQIDVLFVVIVLCSYPLPVFEATADRLKNVAQLVFSLRTRRGEITSPLR